MNPQDIAAEVMATDAALALKGADADAFAHLLDRLEGLVTTLSFLPVAADSDAALRVRFAAAAVEEVADEVEDAEAKARLRLAWRMLDALSGYFGDASGLPPRSGRQTAGMERLLKEAVR